MLSAVADAGPLIHLAEIDQLSLLRIFDAFWIPSAVWAETVDAGRLDELLLAKLGNYYRHQSVAAEVDTWIAQNQLSALHWGERESLYLCQLLKINVLLTDDLAVREAAQRLQIQPVGSLGIVARACQSGILSLNEAEFLMRALQHTSSLFVTPAIIELAVKQLRLRMA
ncbi:MAG: hypothetical protein KDE45_15295 [Caldilineaceae bacterium]|nr:hypothetical protein [Caldilineaceae bacterium]